MESSLCQTCLSRNRRLIPLKKIKHLLNEIPILKINNKNRGICWECHSLILKYFNFKLQVHQAQESFNFKGQHPKCLSNLSTMTKVDYYDFKFTCNDDPLTNVETNIYIKEENDIELCETDNLEKMNSRSLLESKHPVVNELGVELFVDTLKSKTEPDDDVNNVDDENYDNVNFDDGNNDENYEDAKFNDENNEDGKYEDVNFDDGNNDNENGNSDSNVDLDRKNIIFMPDITSSKIPKRKRKTKEENVVENKTKSKIINIKKDPELKEDILKNKITTITYTVEEMQKHREEKRNQPNFKKIPFKCDTCVLGFLSKDKFDDHMKVKHNQSNEYTCDVCLTRYKNKRPLEGHIALHFTRYRCVLCAYETRQLWSAAAHTRDQHKDDKEGKIHCSQCNTLASTKEELIEHINTIHAVYCNECGEKFKGKNTLKTHIARIHNVKREFTCEACKKSFLTKSRLETHVATTHDAAAAKRLAFCVTCNVQYKNLNVYRSHLKTSANHSERSYACSVCDKKFVSKVYWTQHYNFFHLKKSKYSCDLCKKIFMSDWRLKQHKQTQHGHSRSRDHACNICGKKFFTVSTLRGHQFTHSENRTFMCEDCGSTFKQRAALYTHTRLVHKGVKRKR